MSPTLDRPKGPNLMHVIRYVVVLANNGVDRRTARTLDEAAELLGDRDGYVWPVEVRLTPPAFKVSTLGPDDTLIVNMSANVPTAELVDDITHVLTDRLGDRWLVLAGDGAITARAAAQSPATPDERLPWSYYGVELRDTLKRLVEVYPPATVAAAAAELAELIETHGPDRPAISSPVELINRTR